MKWRVNEAEMSEGLPPMATAAKKVFSLSVETATDSSQPAFGKAGEEQKDREVKQWGLMRMSKI